MKVVDPRTFLEEVYMNVELPLTTRMRAAIELLPFVHPKLAVTAQVSEGDFATLLDRRIAHYQSLQRANGSKVIEAKVEAEAEAGPIEIKHPTPASRYRVYRFNRRF